MKYLRLVAWLISFILLLVFVTIGVGCGGGSNTGNGNNNDDNGNVTTYNLKIDRHQNADLTNTRTDQILAEMQNIITTNDGSGDVACGINFTRNGPVGIFSIGTSIINSEVDFSSVNGLQGEVKVVNQINWCGGIAPNIIGCAPVPGKSMMVVRFDESQEGILWLHEYGHNKGLNHRDDPNAVMNGVIGSSHLRINSEECDAYQTISSSLLAGTYFPSMIQKKDTLPVGEFVRQKFVRGVPYEEAIKYTSKHLPELLLMLSDTANLVHWSNVVVTLGIIGDEKAVDSIVDLIKLDQQGKITTELYNAKTGAIMALGYLINRSGSQKALDFLKGCLNPHAWDDSQPDWDSPYQPLKEDRNIQLSSIAILGLTLSGHPEAISALEAIKEPKEDEIEKKFQAQISTTLDQSIGACQEISSNGLLEYYRKNMR